MGVWPLDTTGAGSTMTPAGRPRDGVRRSIRSLSGAREFGLSISLMILIVLFSYLSPYFFSLENFIDIVRQVSLMGIIAMGMTMVIVAGEIDLSVGAVYAAASLIAAACMFGGVPVWISVAIGLIVGAGFGALNGLLTTWVQIPSLIVTLGMMSVARGFALIISNARVMTLSPRTIHDTTLPAFIFLGQGRLFGVPIMSLCFVLVTAICYCVYHRSLLGFRIRAVGSSRDAAIASGINTRMVKFYCFVILGLLSGAAGLLNIAFLGSVSGIAGQGLELSVIAAVIIGGTSLLGGEGTILGTLIGVLLMGVLGNGIVMIGVSPFWQTAIIGMVIIGAVGLDVWTGKQTRR